MTHSSVLEQASGGKRLLPYVQAGLVAYDAGGLGIITGLSRLAFDGGELASSSGMRCRVETASAFTSRLLAGPMRSDELPKCTSTDFDRHLRPSARCASRPAARRATSVIVILGCN